MNIDIDSSGITDIEALFQVFPVVAAKALSIAINETARGPALTALRKEMQTQVNFPEGYLDEPERLTIKQYATPEKLEAVITARDRPTSLARFAAGRPASGGEARTTRGAKGGLVVTVKPGQPRRMPGAFFTGLRNDNVGLAIRLRPGETMASIRAYKPVVLFRDKFGNPAVFLVYGPSVDQVMRGVAEDVAPAIEEALAREFNRQFVVQSGLMK